MVLVEVRCNEGDAAGLALNALFELGQTRGELLLLVDERSSSHAAEINSGRAHCERPRCREGRRCLGLIFP